MAKREYTPEDLEKELQGVDTKLDKDDDDVSVKDILKSLDADEIPEGKSLEEVPLISTETLPPQPRKRRHYDDDDDEEDEVEAELNRLSRDNKNRSYGTLSASESSLLGNDDGDISDDEAEDLIGDDSEYYIDDDLDDDI